ncbi:MAG TPA: thiol reductant ABC exporter subunit CydC, partial [Actinoplanes sp.]
PDAGVVRVVRPSYLPQRPALPHARVVADLFGLGTTDCEIRAALHAVGLDGKGLDGKGLDGKGLDGDGLGGDEPDSDVTPATTLGERGAGVSAGQRHRLALAALLHRAGTEAGTLLLDEPTAHLDPTTEALIIERLRAAASAGSAVLVVAHRPALLAAADRVVPISKPPSDPISEPQSNPRSAPPPAEPTPPNAPRPAEATPPNAPGPAEATPPSAAPQAEATPPSAARPAEAKTDRFWRRPGVAVALGSGSSLAGIVLTGAAAWLLVRAASMPPVLTLSAAVVLVRGSAVARPLLRYVERLVAHDVAFARLGERRSRIYAALVPRVPGVGMRRRGELLTRVVDDVDARVDGLLRGRLPGWTAATVVAVALPVAVLLAGPAAVALVAGLLLAGVAAPAVAARQAAREDAMTGAARARLRDAVVETVDGLEDLAGRADGVPQRRSAVLARLEGRAARAAGRAAALAHLGWGVAVVGTAFLQPGPRQEWAAVLLLGVVALGEPILALPDAAVTRRRAAGAEDRIADLTTEPPAATFPTPPAATFPTPPANPPMRTGKGISARLVGVDAGWDRGRQAVLRGLDLDLPAGARVAVVGRSGSGKSTLGAVVARLLDPRRGTVQIGGVDARSLPEATIRGRVVLVGDETGHIFASSVRANLRLARPGATDAELRAVLARVRLDDWLAALPGGLDAWLGSGGSTMSGGQARRFAVARALLADPGLLVLDEPAEGLDAETAEALMADLLDAAHGRSVLLLTHRAEGLDRVERVLTLADGRLGVG